MKLWLAVFILVTAAASVYGQRQPDTLSRVDQLIAEKEYDAAMQLVSEYIQNNPSGFSAGQRRVRRIVRIRQQFNDLAEQLLNTVEKNPENNAQMIRLIDRMLALENPSNPLVSSFLDRVWRLADFNINRNRLEQVFQTAESLKRKEKRNILPKLQNTI